MKSISRTIALTELLLVFPATLFMAALFLRTVQPAARTGHFVDWFSALPVPIGLYLLLVALPLAAFAIGSVVLIRVWATNAEFRGAVQNMFAGARAHLALLGIAATTLLAGIILALVALHLLTE